MGGTSGELDVLLNQHNGHAVLAVEEFLEAGKQFEQQLVGFAVSVQHRLDSF